MTRKGKIARLPRAIRDELNRRLDNGEPGVRVLKWLNGLPEVKSVLNMEFEGRTIKHCNLTEWKNGGFMDWQAQQQTDALTKDLLANGSELKAVSANAAQAAETITLAHYAAALHLSNGNPDENPQKRLQRMSKSLLDVVRLRRSDLARERMEIEHERLELARLKNQKRQASEVTGAHPSSNGIQRPMSEQEMMALLDKMLLPDDKEPPEV